MVWEISETRFNKSKKSLPILVSLIVVTTLFIGPLSTPIFENVIVIMDKDSSINSATDILRANLDGAIIVDLNSPEYSFTVQRAVGAVIWLSHGCEKGIKTKNSIISWSDFADSLDVLPGKDIVLACQSQHLYENDVSQDVIALGGTVDSVLGSLFISWLLTRNHDLISMAVDRITEITRNPSKIKALYWSQEEQFWAAIDTAIWLLSSLCTTYAIWRATLNPYAAFDIFIGLMVTGTQFAKFIEVMVGFLSGSMSAWTLFTKFGSVLTSFLMIVFCRAPWYVTIIATTELTLSLATGVRVVAALLVIIGFVTLVSAILTDQADADSTYGRMSFGF